MTKIIISFLFIATSIGLIFGYVRPTFLKAEAIKKDTAQYTQALTKAKEIQELKTSLLSQYNLFADGNLGKLKKLLPEHIDNVRLVFDLDGIATQHGIKITGVKIQEAANTETDAQTASAVGFNSAARVSQGYDTRVIKFSTVATYDQFKGFLADLERSLRIVDLVTLSVSPGQMLKTTTISNTSGTSTVASSEPVYVYTFDVGIRTYWLK